MRRLTFIIGLAIGYVAGTRAGRERYEQLARSARGLAQNPGVRNAARSARETAGTAAGRVAEKMGDRLPPSVTEKVPYLHRDSARAEGWGGEFGH